MKKILEYIRTFYHEEFNVAYFVYIGLILSAVITLNYSVDFERRYILNDNRWLMTGAYWLLYAVPLALALLGRVWFQGEKDILRNGRLWALCAFAILPVALDASTNLRFHEVVRIFDVHLHLSLWMAKCLNNFFEFLILFIPAAIYWYYADRREMPLYGVTKKNFEVWPYFLMLLFMAPLIFWASFQADFLESYPRYRTNYAAYYLRINPIWPILTFEFVYGLAFISVEFFYRGFFVLALGRYLGKGAVMPMVVIYCMIHFQKPLLETVSSIFGGMLLGVIVWYGRSIYGGIIAHLGIAWMMEIAAFAQIYIFGNKPPSP